MRKKIVELNLDREFNTSKPVGAAIGAIQKRLAVAKTTVEVGELAYYLNNGATMKMAALNGNKNEDWISQEVFALDFDNSEEDIKKYGYFDAGDAMSRCNEYGIKPAFIYKTFSYTEEKEKFRLVFISDTKVTDRRVRNVFIFALLNLFPEADKACKDYSRLIFGSKQGCVMLYDTETEECPTISPLVVTLASIAYTKKVNNTNAARVIKTFCENTALNMINGMPAITEKTNNSEIDENAACSIYIYNIEGTAKSSKSIIFNFNCTEEEYGTKTIDTESKKKSAKFIISSSKEKVLYEKNFDFEQLENNCQLYRAFINHERWCYHEEIFGIATNLWRYKGAQKRLIDTINSNDDYVDKWNKVNTIDYVSKMQYEPNRCENFCPYASECKNTGLNMLHSVDNKRNNIRRIEIDNKVTLESAYARTEEAIRESIAGDIDLDINIIKAETGIGKTTMLCNIAKEDPNAFNNTIIAVPTHKLLKEIVDKIGPLLNDYVYISQPAIADRDIEIEYTTLQSVGDFAGAKKVLIDYRNSLISNYDIYSEENKEEYKVVNSINDYINASEEAQRTTAAIFCTHKRLLNLRNKNIQKVIIDEDITTSLVQNINIDSKIRNELLNIERVTRNQNIRTVNGAISSLLDYLDEVDKTIGIVIDNSLMTAIDNRELRRVIKECKPSFNLKDLLDIKAAIKNEDSSITAYKRNNIPFLQTTILSATANLNVYRALLDNRKIDCFDAGLIEHTGHIIQHYAGMSRSYINKNFDKVTEKIKKEAPGIENVISFKKFNSKFQEAGFTTIAHFGACTGIDAYGGEDLIVLGTPHMNINVYLLLAHACGVRQNIITNIEYKNIVRNGFEFTFSSFNEYDTSKEGNLLREIQFYLIESELVQAVGRARALRNDCSVHIFSNLPLTGVKLYQENDYTYNIIEEMIIPKKVERKIEVVTVEKVEETIKEQGLEQAILDLVRRNNEIMYLIKSESDYFKRNRCS